MMIFEKHCIRMYGRVPNRRAHRRPWVEIGPLPRNKHRMRIRFGPTEAKTITDLGKTISEMQRQVHGQRTTCFSGKFRECKAVRHVGLSVLPSFRRVASRPRYSSKHAGASQVCSTKGCRTAITR